MRARRTEWQEENAAEPTPEPRKPVGYHCDECFYDARECECCDLPLNREGRKSPGIGYYCEQCMPHFNAGTAPGWGTDPDAELQAVEDDHRRMWDEFMAKPAA